VTPDPSLTWLDRQQPAAVYAAAGELANHPALTGHLEESSGDPHFAVWLALVDFHMARLLDTSRAELGSWDWRCAYDNGMSPRTAALSAFAEHQSSTPAAYLPPTAPDRDPPASEVS
jgi:hypothetical protein